MGTNLSQVFISDALTALSGTVFNNSGDAADDVGIWNLAGNAGAGEYHAAALYQATADLTDDDAGEALVAIANPLWFINDFQVVQRTTSGNWIASPMINVRNVRSIRYDDHVASTGHTLRFTPNATFIPAGAGNVTVKFVIRTTPVDQLSFYDASGTGMVDISNEGRVFPLGAFNTTNHKVISIEIHEDDYTNTATFLDAIVAQVEDHALLDNLINLDDQSTYIDFIGRFPGFIFDVLFNDSDGDSLIVPVTAANRIVLTSTTGFVPGVGNDWQVLGEEIRCRSRYGNFNRMYFPQNFETFTRTGGAYDKVTIQYEHNWPTSTGIAPAGTLNQISIYYTNAGADPTTTANDFDDLFAYTAGTSRSFNW
jgi:hypothetical protein